MSRCVGVSVVTGRPCRARAVHGTAWCAFHHPLDRPVEGVGGPWDGHALAAPRTLGLEVPLARQPGAPGNATWALAVPEPQVLGRYRLAVADTFAPDLAATRRQLRPDHQLCYWWVPA